MLKRRGFIAGFWGWLLFWSLPRGAWADKSKATINGPHEAKMGEEVTLEVVFSHSANSPTHYTQWAEVVINGQQVSRWDFTPNELPEGASFTRKVRVKVEGDLEVMAQASCNRHGTKGPATLKIKAR